MKIEEAIYILKNSAFLSNVSEYLAVEEAINLAVEALEKQIPKKPTGEHYAHMRCPSCNHRIPSGMGSSSRRRDNWCNYCGQKILWED